MSFGVGIQPSNESEESAPKGVEFSFSPFLAARKLVVDNVAESIAVFENVDKLQYKRFVSSLAPKEKDGEKLVGDEEAEKVFRSVLTFEVDLSKKDLHPKEYFKLKQQLRKRVLSSVSTDDALFTKSYVSAVENKRDIEVSKRIMVLGGKNPGLIEKFCERRRALDGEYNDGRGQMSESEYFEKRKEINEETAVESGDKDLQKQLEEYKNDSSVITFDDIYNTVVSNESLVTDPKELNSAFQGVVPVGMNFSVNGDGSASVVVGNELPVEVFVKKNVQNGEFFYYLRDKFSNEGVTRTDASNFILALDRRHIDAFVSKNIGVLPDESTSVADIPDKDLVFIGEKLIGIGEKRGYRIDGVNRELLLALVNVLKADDEKYSTLSKRVEILRNFFEAEDNIELARQRLRSGGVFTLSELLSA